MRYTFSDDDEVFFASSYDDLLNQVKEKNPHTSSMTLEEYRKFTINNAAGFGKQLPENASSKEITDVWQELGVVTILT